MLAAVRVVVLVVVYCGGKIPSSHWTFTIQIYRESSINLGAPYPVSCQSIVFGGLKNVTNVEKVLDNGT